MQGSILETAETSGAGKAASVATKARIIIPVWGAKYVARLGSACLPALLAPGTFVRFVPT